MTQTVRPRARRRPACPPAAAPPTRGAANQSGAHVNKNAFAEAQGLPAPQRHRPRRVLGRQRAPGAGLLPGPVGLHAGRLRRPGDGHPRPGELRHAPARHHARPHRAAHARRRDRRARPSPRRRRQRHRVPGRRRRPLLARDDEPRRASRRSSPSSSTAARTAYSAGRPSTPTARSSTRSSIGATTTACSRPATAGSRSPPRPPSGLSLLEIDHCVGNVELGDMNRFVDYYRDVFGFAQLVHYDDKVIHTDYSALMSKVMTNGNGRVKFPINEPASGKKKSQIQEFLDYYLDSGTQHVALRTEDIVATVRRLRENGVEFLGMPHAYYETLADRVGDVGVPMDDARGAGHRGRPRRGGLPPPDLHPADPGPPDVLLRDHRAPRLARLRSRQLQGALRGDRARAGAAREPLAQAPAREPRRELPRRRVSVTRREPEGLDDRLDLGHRRVERGVRVGGIDLDDDGLPADVQDHQVHPVGRARPPYSALPTTGSVSRMNWTTRSVLPGQVLVHVGRTARSMAWPDAPPRLIGVGADALSPGCALRSEIQSATALPRPAFATESQEAVSIRDHDVRPNDDVGARRDRGVCWIEFEDRPGIDAVLPAIRRRERQCGLKVNGPMRTGRQLPCAASDAVLARDRRR